MMKHLTQRGSRLVSGGLAPWSDLNHDVLLLVMMQLEVVDFLAFGGVCKSWRSFALSNRKKFMTTKTPMSIGFSTDTNEKEYCYLEDFKGSKVKTIVPHSANWTCIGVTCGYLIFLGIKTPDFWVVNPITKHEIHFPCLPLRVTIVFKSVKAILVFSPLISRWVLVILNRHTNHIWLSIADKQEWTHVSTSLRIIDSHGFKGKIYILDSNCSLYEMILYPNPKLMLLKTKNLPKPEIRHLEFASSVENLYVCHLKSKIFRSEHPYKFNKLDFGEMKCVSLELRKEEFAIFHDDREIHSVVIPESWHDISSKYRRYVKYDRTDKGGKCKYFYASMWYCFHDFLDANRMSDDDF